MRFNHLLITLFVMFLFGSSYPIGKIGLNQELSPLIFSLIRILMMVLFLFPFLRLRSIHKTNFKFVLVYGALMGLGLYPFMYLSLAHTPSTSSMILVMQFSIPFGVIAGSFYLGEKVSQKRWLLIGLVLFGLAIICFDPIVLQSPDSLMLGCLAAISYGLASMMSRKLVEFSALEVNAWMAITTLPIMFLLAFLFENQEFNTILQHSWWDYLPAIYTGVVVSCGAQVLMFWLYKHYSVQTVLPFYSLFPIFGIILTILLIQESLSFYIVLGSIIVIAGNYLLQKTK